MTDADHAIVVRRSDGRYYCGVSPAGRIQTAWSLAGAKLFGCWQDSEIIQARLELDKRGSQAECVIVRVEP